MEEKRRSARLRAKGRRRWAAADDDQESDGDGDGGEKINSADDDSPTKELEMKKRNRIAGLDDEDDEEENEDDDDEYVESEEDGGDSSKKRLSSKSRRRDVGVRRRGRPPRAIPDENDNETDVDEEDAPTRYKIPIEIYGMQKYYLMDGYVYRRHRDRRVGLRGMYLRCYQDKSLHCPARGVAVWFKKKTPNVESGERPERFLLGRRSTIYSNHTHQKPPKGHFWVKPNQNQIVFVPPHLRKSTSIGDGSAAEFTDFTEHAAEADFVDEREATPNVGSKRDARASSKSSMDHQQHDHEPIESKKRPIGSGSQRRDVSVPPKKRTRLSDSNAGESKITRPINLDLDIDSSADNRSSNATTTMPVKIVGNGSYYLIDGYAFKKPNRQQSQLICVEAKRDSKCNSRAKLSSLGTEAQFPNKNARKHTHERPRRGQYVLPATVTSASILDSAPVPTPTLASIPVSSTIGKSTAASKSLPASVGLLLFSRTPFLRPLTAKGPLDDIGKTRSVNLKSIMNCYRYCLDALIRLQDGDYVGRFPQLNRLVDTPGSFLIEYYMHRSDGRLPMIAGDERTKFFLNHEMKHYRAVCDYMLIASNDCERMMEAYKRWLKPSRSRAWWNNGDILEYACRVMLRSEAYQETYEMALSTSQRSVRLRHLFRPVLPLPEPKFLRCEKETVRRWEMRQSLENINSRITSIRLRDGDSDTAINRLLDEFDSAATSFLKVWRKCDKDGKMGADDDEVSLASGEDWRPDAETISASTKKKAGRRGLKKQSPPVDDPPPVLTVENMSGDHEPEFLSDDTEPVVAKSKTRQIEGKDEEIPEKLDRSKVAIALRELRSKESDEESTSGGDDYDSSGDSSPRPLRSKFGRRGGRGKATSRGRGRGRLPQTDQRKSLDREEIEAAEDVRRPPRGRGGRGRISRFNSKPVGDDAAAAVDIGESDGGGAEKEIQVETRTARENQNVDHIDIARELDALEAFAAETPDVGSEVIEEMQVMDTQ